MASKTEHLAPYTDFRWSRLDYENLAASGILTPEDRVELLDGRIITRSPQQTSHATATRLLRAFLAEAYSPDQFVVDPQLPLALDANSEPEPDLMVVRGEGQRLQRPSSHARRGDSGGGGCRFLPRL